MCRITSLVVVAGLGLAGCGGSESGEVGLQIDPDNNAQRPTAIADFSLEDGNRSSPRAGQMVSPRDYLQMVSGWYFTHAS